MNEIIGLIDIGKKYKLYGEDYEIIISPINDANSLNSAYIDFLECENILRKKHNLSSTEILTILQIEIDKMIENGLTNQIEYTVFDEKKHKLNLSFCENIEIKINYYIKNQTLLNMSMILYYS